MTNTYIKRDILNDLRQDLSRDEITFLVGPRQAGKTTLMKVLEEELATDNKKTLFLNLDFEYDKEYFQSQQSLLKKIELEMGKDKGFVFIDEIQRKDDAGVFLKGIKDMGLPYKFIVSGSGSVDLKAKIRESMVGRKRIFEIYPLSIKEFVNYKTGYRYEDNLNDFFTIERQRANQLMLEYMNFGGYPRVVLEVELKEKLRTIDDIYQSYIAKDIAFLLKVEKTDAFSSLIKVLANQTGKLINYSELSATLGISLQTIKHYLWFTEETYIMRRMTPFYRNTRSEISKSPTIYFSDTGLRNYSLGIFGQLTRPDDLGFTFQNLVYLLVREKLRWTGANIHYWRSKSGGEVDFIVDTGRTILPIEVKYSEFSTPVITRSIRSFIEKYKPVKCIIINKNLKTSIQVNSCEIQFATFWDMVSGDHISQITGIAH
jgi:uncharacterized protein